MYDEKEQTVGKRIWIDGKVRTFTTTISLSNGVSIGSVSKMLGHTSIKTMQIYALILNSKISGDMDVFAAQSALFHIGATGDNNALPIA
jgi:hypothetical protein